MIFGIEKLNTDEFHSSSGNTLQAFSDAAKKTSGSGTPANVAGGIVGPAAAVSGSTSSSAPAQTSAPASNGGGDGYGGGGSTSTPSGASSFAVGHSIVASTVGAALAMVLVWAGLV